MPVRQAAHSPKLSPYVVSASPLSSAGGAGKLHGCS